MFSYIEILLRGFVILFRLSPPKKYLITHENGYAVCCFNSYWRYCFAFWAYSRTIFFSSRSFTMPQNMWFFRGTITMIMPSNDISISFCRSSILFMMASDTFATEDISPELRSVSAIVECTGKPSIRTMAPPMPLVFISFSIFSSSAAIFPVLYEHDAGRTNPERHRHVHFRKRERGLRAAVAYHVFLVHALLQ